MAKSSKGLVGGIVALGLVGSGSAFGYRTRMVSQRREGIAQQQKEADQTLNELNDRVRKAEAAHHIDMRRAEEMREVVQTIWDDRRMRYGKAVRDNESYLVAAPEAIGVLHGILHHAKFLESVLPSFARFDARAHQIQSLLLSLTTGRSVGVGSVGRSLAKLHSYDPFVRTVGEHVAATVGTSDAPRSIKEVSDSFAYCHNTLQKALDGAQSRLVIERTVVPTSPSLMTQALSLVLERLRARDNATDTLANQLETEAIARHKSDLRILNTHADVRAALVYSEQLSNSYRNLIASAKASGEASAFADPSVGDAVSQIDVWRQSVLTFLIEEQAQRALDAYSLCIVDTMTQMVNEGLPATVPAAA